MEMLKRLFGNTRQADLGTPSQFGAAPDTRLSEAEALVVATARRRWGLGEAERGAPTETPMGLAA